MLEKKKSQKETWLILSVTVEVFIMKLPRVRVTVNDGEYEGIGGVIIGYDRNKYYSVKLDNGSVSEFKGYYLDGISKLKGHTRYLLQYNFYDKPLTHKELTLDKNKHTGKGKGYNKRFRFFDIYINYGSYEKCISDLNFEQLKSKVRMAMSCGYTFDIFMVTYGKHSSSFTQLLEFKNDSILMTYHGKKERLYYGTFERGLIKTINKY